MVSPPKPWERAGALSSQPSAQPASTGPTTPANTTTANVTPTAPSVPDRPSSLTNSTAASSLASTSNPLAQNALTHYGTSPYASPYSRMGAYSSPYSTYGAGYGGYGTGYGSTYGSTYGGIGGLYGGYGSMGMGAGGMMPYDPNNPSIFQQVGNSTSQTFALIQSIVQTFGGFAQMLDSTFMATQSSFFAMLGVAEQFSNLRMALGQVAGVFGLVAWLRQWWRGERNISMAEEFRRFVREPGSVQPNGNNGGAPGAPRPSKKPLIFFLLAVFGLPYVMSRIIRHLASRLPPPPQLDANGNPVPQSQQQLQEAIDPSKVTFARATWAFATSDPVELGLEKNEIVAVLSTLDPLTGAEGEWWRGRTRDGRIGWFPRNYVEIIKSKDADRDNGPPPPPPPPPGTQGLV